MTDLTQRIHLVRHGEVENPEHLVYADLPGFGLSAQGMAQAEAAAELLAAEPIAAVWSSPLERALQTATTIASFHDLPVRVLASLTEWGLLGRWRGIPWEDVPGTFPGELEAYLEDPGHLVASPETLADLSERMRDAVELAAALSEGPLVVVGHQDPIHAAVRTLTGLGLAEFHRSKPNHAEVITLEGPPWQLTGRVAAGAGGGPR